MTFNALHLTVMYILKCVYYNCNTFALIMLSTLWNVNVKIPEETDQNAVVFRSVFDLRKLSIDLPVGFL